MTPQEREGILQIISDLSKDATGSRIRLPYGEMSDEELDGYMQYYITTANRRHELECLEKLASQKQWEVEIARYVAMGARSRAAAIRWDMQAYGANDDVGYYCYLRGIAYELEPRIEEELK